jgi:ABC-type phosphate/phosphonate transport system substrate-binding protein
MPMEYEEAIHRLAGWQPGDQPYLARMTPYAYVAAEMLGANFEILATYNSRATTATTYFSYFVVNRRHFARPNPGLNDLLEFLRRKPATFIYHDRFSTSSYFLPSLYFRSQRVFVTSEPPDASDQTVRLHVARDPGGSSSALVEQVARGAADVAAVWDGTKQKFQQGPLANQVYFIQLPDPVPNDLLVYSRRTPQPEVDRLRKAIASMTRHGAGEINTGDYRWWEDFKRADAARSALANLRRIAAQHRAPVTVEIKPPSDGDEWADSLEHVEAARQAVRLSGSEFVLFDEDLHDHKDVVWTLELVHEGAIALKSDIIGSGVAPQRFQISFSGAPDLTKRIGTLIHSRMHRIRYVWPYEQKSPTIVRDVDFSIGAGTVKGRRITWLNPERNHFREGPTFEAAVRHADFYKFILDDTGFPKVPGEPGWAYEPMSNIAYRVILVRPAEKPLFIQALTGVILVLLGGAAAACTVDVRRREARGSR